jgi:hypothetical protein
VSWLLFILARICGVQSGVGHREVVDAIVVLEDGRLRVDE